MRRALFACLIVRVGPWAIYESFAQMSWGLLVVLVFPCMVMKAFDTFGWRFAFSADTEVVAHAWAE